MALGLSVASDIANAALTMYVRGSALLQTMQERPLLKALKAKQKSFPGGKDNVSLPVQGAVMNDTAGFFAGYTEDDALTFTQAANILRAAYAWKEAHAGLIITWTELKKDGVTVNDNNKTSEHSQAELTRLTSILQNRLEDFGESWSRAVNNMFWRDGSQDSKVTPGVTSLLLANASASLGSTGGLSRVTYSWWRNRTNPGNLSIVPGADSQELTKTLQKELTQLRRFGGKPNRAFVGSDFLQALRLEAQAKGIYTQSGFVSGVDIGVGGISITGLGEFIYDPTLDDLGAAKYCYIYDDRRLTAYEMEGEGMKTLSPTRPYNYAVYMNSLTWTGALCVNQLNACGVYSVA